MVEPAGLSRYSMCAALFHAFLSLKTGPWAINWNGPISVHAPKTAEPPGPPWCQSASGQSFCLHVWSS